ncbi:dephospho-CoA kinase [Cyclobacteriaceae bacterium]|nr:dephospho-CoA kinase [Cyclobacteriaceae bacterium]
MKVAITGGIGSGKSVVCYVFEKIGYPVFYADQVAKDVVEHDLVKEQVISLLGKEAFDEQGYNRSYVAQQVFADKQLLLQLNNIIHPEVKKAYDEFVKNHQGKITFKESALVFEEGIQDEYDAVMYVYASEAIRLKRTLSRDAHRSEVEVKNIMSHQVSFSKASLLADFVIINEGDESVLEQINEILEILHSEL